MKAIVKLLELVRISRDRNTVLTINRIEGLVRSRAEKPASNFSMNTQPGDPALPGRIVFDSGSRHPMSSWRHHRG